MRSLLPFLLPSAVLFAACGDKDDDFQPVTSDTDTTADDTGTTGGGDDDTGGGGGDDTGDDGGGQDGIPDPSSAELLNPADFDWYASANFSLDGVQGGFDGVTVADVPEILCTTDCPDEVVVNEGFDMFPIDSEFAYETQDFYGHWAADRDGLYTEGYAGEIASPDGEPWGLALSDQDTDLYKTGYPLGSWCGGLGGDTIKCSTEHFVTMEHVLTCDETVPYMFSDPYTGDPDYPECEPLDTDLYPTLDTLTTYSGYLEDIAVTDDYGVTLKDDGKLLYRWGTYEKRPRDVRVQLSLPLPEEWNTEEFRVTKATLAVVHTITNNPNDQIRPEDLENEGATGRKPSYIVDGDGNWVSDKDCFEGDGDFIPAGTVLRNVAYADPEGGSSDLQGGFTNAWYTTMDREPFDTDPVTGLGPRWRLQAGKFGQDLPSVDIPIVNCQEPPLQKGEAKYETGELTTTFINLLDWAVPEESPFLSSKGFQEWTIQEEGEVDGVTINGTVLTNDLDIVVYIKGDKKPVYLYSAHLYLDFEPM